MDDRYSMRAPLRPLGRGVNPVAPPPAEDDPLVELARIVSGRSAPAPRRRASTIADEPGMSEADLARDLEAELLSDLQASLAAVGEAHDFGPAEGEQTFTDEGYVTAQYQDDPSDQFQDEPPPDEGAYAFDPEPRPVEEPPASAGSLFVGDEEPEDLRPYRPQSRQPQAPRAEPAADTGGDFGHLGLRRGNKRVVGAAYNPQALAPEPAAAPPAPPNPGWDAGARPVSYEPFETVARQTFDPPSAEPDFRGVDEFDDRLRQDPLAEAEEDFRFAPIVPPEPARKSRGRLGTVLMGLVAIGVAAAAYVYFRGDTVAGGPPLILADTSPVREAPANPTAPEPPNAIFTRIDPTEGAAPVVLAPGVETPVDPAANAAAPADGITTLLGDPGTPVDPAADDRRLVRTVVMAPDGTIVNNRAGEAGLAPAPLPTTMPPAAAANPVTPADPVTPLVTPAPAAVATATAPPLTTTTIAPAPVAAAANTTATPTATPAAGTGIASGWYVQVSSQTSEAAAQADIAAFRARAPALLGSRNAVIPTATVNGVVRYRVQFGPATSQADAQSLCTSLKAAGIDCITANNP